MNAFPLPWFVSGEGGPAEGGSDGAAREGGNWNTSPLMLIKFQREISGHFVVSMNLCRAVAVNNLAIIFAKYAHRLEVFVRKKSVFLYLPAAASQRPVGFTSTIQMRYFSTWPVCIAA